MISLDVALRSLLRSVLRAELILMVSSRKATAPRAAAPCLAMAFLLLIGLSFPAFSQSPTIHATIDASKTGTPISKYLYGQFLEHGGDIVNTGVWSEMLVDRKFFYPVAGSLAMFLSMKFETSPAAIARRTSRSMRWFKIGSGGRPRAIQCSTRTITT